MKILIYGAGVIGCTYGWQLHNAGCEVTFMVRKDKKHDLEQNGFNLYCTDYRQEPAITQNVPFRPPVIDTLSSQNDFEYIIVATNCIYLKDVLPTLSQGAGKAHILFFQNMWDDFDLISHYLLPEQYFFGFPFMAGGGREGSTIHSVISGLKYSHTPLGEADGTVTPRVQKLAEAMNRAALKPVVYHHIVSWLIIHYAVAAGLSGGIMKAGSSKAFVSNKTIMKETIKAIREGLEVCKKRGIDLKTDKAGKLYYLPLFISIPIARKIYSDKALQSMFDGHTQHAGDEMRKMMADIIGSGKQYAVDAPCLEALNS